MKKLTRGARGQDSACQTRSLPALTTLLMKGLNLTTTTTSANPEAFRLFLLLSGEKNM